MLDKKHFQNLADIVGEEFFSTEEYMTKLYSHDISALPGIVNEILNPHAEAVAQPTTTEITSNLLKYCKEHNIQVVPRGHGTSGYGGALPTKGGLVLDMTRMNQIYDIDKGSMTIEVGAGIIWGRLIEYLEDEGLSIATYPSSAPSCTVGGWVAAGGCGIGSTKYGGIRENVVEMEVVLPDGQIISTIEPIDSVFTDGKPKTFFPGDESFFYEREHSPESNEESTSLFVDSNGVLGVITKVTLKLIHIPTIKPMTISFPNKEQAMGAMQAILRITRPFYLHFIADEFYGMLKEIGKAPDTAGEWLVLCALEGTDQENEEFAAKISETMSMYHGTVESDEIGHHEWEERFYPMRVKRLGPSLAPSEVYVPLERMVDFMDHCKKHFKGERMAMEGAVNHQNEVAVLTWGLGDERRRIPFMFGWYRSLDVINIGLKHGGRAYSIGMWNVAHARDFYGKENYTRMSKLKQRTDPKNYLNSHKVFPGPLNLSPRMGYLIMLAAAIATPIAIMFAWWLVPSLIGGFVPWVVVNDPATFILWGLVGLGIGFAAQEFVNLLPISVMLSIGTPILRWGRKIFH
jgi:FAD/FMN-containing dehydrogenase